MDWTLEFAGLQREPALARSQTLMLFTDFCHRNTRVHDCISIVSCSRVEREREEYSLQGRTNGFELVMAAL